MLPYIFCRTLSEGDEEKARDKRGDNPLEADTGFYQIHESPCHLPLYLQIVYRIGKDREPHRGPGRRTGEMINAGLAEYAALLTGIGGTTLTSVEPSITVIAIVGGIIFLFWLVVFKL
jgi:hypothetical protein